MMCCARKGKRSADSPSNPTFATELHFVTGLVTMTTCSGHVLRLDLYLLEEGRTNVIFLVQQNKQSTSNVQVGDIHDFAKSPVVCCIVEAMQSYQTSNFVFEFCHVVVAYCLMMVVRQSVRKNGL